ncbi:SulP family inorganic anion transporter [Candidatus Uabimicrobium amorphum]|uniref:Sulfate transporter n=1 Tax=Uabimicrobium amorphum TaxID=2596890 RepID=A0A5S9F3P9_UABAM|nr:SulP family inorganic anion transporter [Candidatus Uabimicrobium amorphum]BBM84965.1 sulfate transporter [Candidatus Uabimicrobium amorphum]
MTKNNASVSQNNMAQEILSSVVVFLVALPLCIGIAVASGLPNAVEKGLITGIVGGIVVGFLAGCPLQVSGPAAGLAIIIKELIENPDIGIAGLGAIVFAAGIIQLVAGSFRLGRMFRAISPAVIVGMLSGIGVLIFSSQFHVMIDDKIDGGGIQQLISIPGAFVKVMFPMATDTHHLAAYAGVLTIVTLLLWNKFRPEKLKFIPGTLLGVAAAVIFVQITGYNVDKITLPKSLVTKESLLNWGDAWSILQTQQGIILAFTVAIVASAETLLCATAVDKLHDGQRTNYDKELFAQGVGNIICGYLGSLPMTGVIVRSSANINSGAKTRYSAILHGFWLLLFIAIFPGVINLIPKASLAAILVYIGIKLINVGFIKELKQYGRSEVVIYIATIAGIVATNLLTGIMIGFGLAILKMLYTMNHLSITVTKEKDPDQECYVMRFDGSATFLKIPELAKNLEALPLDSEIHIHLDGLSYIDHACIDLLKSHSSQVEKRGGKMVLCWDSVAELFQKSKMGKNTEKKVKNSQDKDSNK